MTSETKQNKTKNDNNNKKKIQVLGVRKFMAKRGVIGTVTFLT